MRDGTKIAVIIPALNEEKSIGKVISAIPGWVDDIVVVDNGSTDRTAERARDQGARVLHEPRRGYGSACLKGIERLDNPDVVVFLDGDFSDYPEEMGLLVDPVIWGKADMVIGSRVLGRREPGALTPQAMFGNWLACNLVRFFWNVGYTDLGPFRAISYPALRRLLMRDPDYGWTIEMQIKAARVGLRVQEAPVSYRRRVGKSKVSGTVRGVIGAGIKILGAIFLHAVRAYPAGATPSSVERLIVFSRYPVPGRTKTRLIPELGPQGAADLQRRMTEHILSRVGGLSEARGVTLVVRYEGGNDELMAEWLGLDVSLEAQGEGDIGERMHRAFSDSFGSGTARVVIIGSDSPGVSEEIIERAFEGLWEHDVVLGPANDGGYYLVGLKRPVPPLFVNVSWGTDRVFEDTLRIAAGHGLSCDLVDPLDDVDRPEDLQVWEEIAGEKVGSGAAVSLADRVPEETPRSRGFPPIQVATPPRQGDFPALSPDEPVPVKGRISVIVPALNEAPGIGSALERVRHEENVEIIVVDGGSTDTTVECARSLGAEVMVSPRGRARQMNVGANAASGEILLFLHADTLLPAGWSDSVRDVVRLPGTAGGAFELRIDTVLPFTRIIERLANLRSRLLQMPYGDQAIFLKAGLFHSAGGFPDLPIMEDFELVRRLRKMGRITIIPAPATTSVRRWKKLGVIRAALINQLIVVAYLAGVSPRVLARVYQEAREGVITYF